MTRISTMMATGALVYGVSGFAAQPEYQFEDLGRPLKPKPLTIEVVTRNQDGRQLAWGAITSPERKGLIGIDIETGASTWVDLAQYDYGRINVSRAPNGHLYLYTGRPGHFLKLDIDTLQLHDLGVPADPASYTMGGAAGPDGTFYVGAYPDTTVVWIDPADDTIGTLGPMTADPRNKYVITTAVSDANVVYVAVGLHHAELWAYDRRTGHKHQIVPAEIGHAHDRVRIWTAEDGMVYGRAGSRHFRCHPDHIEMIESAPPGRSDLPLRRAGDRAATTINTAGQLTLKHVESGESTLIQTDFDGVSVHLYGVFCEHGGKIYGGGFQPANVFEYDPVTHTMRDLGRRNAGRIQIYDILSHPRGLFISSYVGAHLDFYNPETGETRHIATLLYDYEQERGLQLILGPDQMIYLASRPAKGKLGGALTRIDPESLDTTCWRNILSNQSVISVVAVPSTGEVFGTSSVYGGSGCVPTEKEGYVFLWNCEREELSWKATPIPGDISYGKAVMARTGLIYVQAHDKYLVIDPVKRELVHRGAMPVNTVRRMGIADSPAGRAGLIYGLGDDAVFAFDPADHQARIIARHPSIEQAKGIFVTAEAVLYYACGSRLWRVDLEP